jgi:hypothetical protein
VYDTNATAFGCHVDSIMEIGWDQLTIETSGEYADADQSYAAGFLEGILTQKYIFNFVEDTIVFLFESAIEYADGDLNPPKQFSAVTSPLENRIQWMKEYLSLPRADRISRWRAKLQRRGIYAIINYLMDYFDKQDAWIQQQVQQNPQDAYWQQIGIIKQQYQ